MPRSFSVTSPLRLRGSRDQGQPFLGFHPGACQHLFIVFDDRVVSGLCIAERRFASRVPTPSGSRKLAALESTYWPAITGSSLAPAHRLKILPTGHSWDDPATRDSL